MGGTLGGNLSRSLGPGMRIGIGGLGGLVCWGFGLGGKFLRGGFRKCRF
jgi:hypothetical protein